MHVAKPCFEFNIHSNELPVGSIGDGKKGIHKKVIHVSPTTQPHSQTLPTHKRGNEANNPDGLLYFISHVT